MILLVGSVFAEKLGLEINYEEGVVDFKITVYDEMGVRVKGISDYTIKDYYGDIKSEGKASSGENINFVLPRNPRQGPWEISVSYNNGTIRELFNVGDIEKIDIKLQEDNLILENIGNVDYEDNILIYIGDEDQTAKVYLLEGQIKKIRLTGDGVYDIRVDPGTQEEIVFSQVSLTGNVIGLERVIEGGFWSRYPLVSLFLSALVLVIVVIFGLKGYKRFGK